MIEGMTPADGTLEDRFVGGLDEDHREVASTLTGPLCVLAGAGTG